MKNISFVVKSLFFLIGLLALLSPRSACAYKSSYYFRHLTDKDGLSQNTVNAIIQDQTGFMWFGTKDGLNRYDGRHFKIYHHRSTDSLSLCCNLVISLFEDSKGHIWVGTEMGVSIYHPDRDIFTAIDTKDKKAEKPQQTVYMIKQDRKGCIWMAASTQGLYCYDPHNRTLKHYDFNTYKNMRSHDLVCFEWDNNGRIWLGFLDSGLYYSDDGMRTVHPFVDNLNQRSCSQDVITKLHMGTHNRLYIATTKCGVKELNLTSGIVRQLTLNEEGSNIYCRDLLYTDKDELWIGTEHGLYIHNTRSGNSIHLQSDVNDPYSLSDNAVYSLYKDKENGIWVGSYFGGADYYSYPFANFEKYYPTGKANSLHGRRVREFCRDDEGKIWIGTEDCGLNRFDPQTKKFTFFEPSRTFSNIHGLCMSDGKLWVGTFANGLKVIDIKTQQVIHSFHKGSTKFDLNDDNAFVLLRATTGDIYIGTVFQLMRYNCRTKQIDNIPQIWSIYDMKEDLNGNIWVATYNSGIFCYNATDGSYKNYRHHADRSDSLPFDDVISIFVDSKGRIWLATQGSGFCQFNAATQTVKQYTTANGLPSDVVFQIIEDKKGMLWLTTGHGLVRFNPQNEQIKVFTTADGLLSNQFNYKSSFIDRDGTIYLGSIDGFIAFNPENFSTSDFFPRAVITDLYIQNKNIQVGDASSPLKKQITYTDKIRLTSKQNSFSLRVAALSFQAPGSNQLKVKLEGFDKDWVTVDGTSLITYTNLHYGSYIFKVEASNTNGIWNGAQTKLQITILPPFYLSLFARIVYVILAVGALIFTVLYFKRRADKQRRRQISLFEEEKQREIYKAKYDFFTNITHEIRTPLTLIKGPLENILKRNNVDSDTYESLNIMQRNTERLLSLTNQLLDFRKLEEKTFTLSFENCDVVEVLSETFHRFVPAAQQKKIDFELHVPQTGFSADINKESFIKIVSNLLNNALKYASSYAIVELEEVEEEHCFLLRTRNDGEVVPAKMREEIFKPFVRYEGKNSYQSSIGSGIGLPLARSLAELHNGSLVMSDSESENIFTLTIPLTQKECAVFMNEKQTAPVQKDMEDLDDTILSKTKPSVLIVDDDIEMLNFVAKQLRQQFHIITADSGNKALQEMDTQDVHVVVSDVMMPGMNGFELCKTIKSELKYSHIPVVLLTAKTDVQSKIEGIETGADAYIEKPFSTDYLLATVSGLIENRDKLRQAFANSPFATIESMSISKADKEFIADLSRIVQENLSNADFTMESLGSYLNMSRSSLYRKIGGILDMPPSEYLRIERLKYAARLLKEGKYAVSEICYMAGFSYPSYFARCFQKQFGVLPKDFH